MILWHWFCRNLNITHFPTSLNDLWRIDGHSSQYSLVINSSIVFIIYDIWNAKNNVTFNNNNSIVISTIARIKAQISCTDKHYNQHASSPMDDFVLIKAFNISLRSPRAPSIKEFIWHPLVNG